MTSNMDIARELECPICTEYMTGNIFQCVAGHSLCAECVTKLNACPTCNKPLDSIRNYTLEAIAAKVKLPCHNSDDGCEINLSLCELKEHSKTCTHRAYDCQLGWSPCSWRGRIFTLLAHARKDHLRCCVDNKWVASWKRNESSDNRVTLVQMKGEIFYVHHKVRGETMYWAVQFLGTPTEADGYRYNIGIGGQNDERDLSITDNCCTDLQSIEEVIEEKACSHLPLSLFERYADTASGKVFFDVTVLDRGTASNCWLTNARGAPLPHKSYECHYHGCPLRHGRANFTRGSFLNHVDTTHGYVKDDDWHIDGKPSDKTMLIEKYGSLFYAYQKRKDFGRHDKKVYWVVQCLDGPEEARKYYYEVLLDDKNYKADECSHCSQDVYMIIRNHQCPFLPIGRIVYDIVSIVIKRKSEILQ